MRSLNLLFVSAASLCQATFFYPDPRTSWFEHILVDTHGAKASNFTTAITPCSNYVTGQGAAGALIGRTTAAQWLRVAFHDFITANVTAGTGGIDASIGFETLREENSGSAFNDSFTFWRPFVSSYVSMADMVAISTVMSVQNCGGSQIPFKGGRVDATGPGVTTGVPAPDTDLETTLLYFERAGFNQVDSIGLTACGHTLGSVHHGGFPQVVPESAVTPNNTAGGIHLDTSFTNFDNTVVQEYLGGYGQGGGPLVTSANETSRSDLRLYESDQNVTMEALGSLQNAEFIDKCAGLLGRMLDTVPSGVTLGKVVTPITVKLVNATYDLDEEYRLIFSGYIRTLTAASAKAPTAVDVSLAGLYQKTLSAEDETGSSIYGTTTYFPFLFPIQADSNKTLAGLAPPATGLSTRSSGLSVHFTASAVGLASQTFNVNVPLAFIIPSLSSASRSGTATAINITIASLNYLDEDTLTIKVHVPVGQAGTLAPQITEWDQRLQSEQVKGLWQISSANMSIDKEVTGLITVELFFNNQLWDTVFLNSGVAGW